MGGMRKAFLVLLCMSTGVVGCAAQQGASSRYDAIKAETEVIEVRLTNFEERLALVEQEIGVLRSHGGLPEGARWVDPAPSLSKVGGNEGPVSSPSTSVSARQSPSSSASTLPSTLPEAQVISPEQSPSPSLASPRADRLPSGANTSAIDQFIGGGSEQGIMLGQGSVHGNEGQGQGNKSNQPSPQRMPSLTPLQDGLTAQGGKTVSPSSSMAPTTSVAPVTVYPSTASLSTASPQTARPSHQATTSSPQVKPTPSTGSGSLKGLPTSFRTGVRAYDEALAMYYRHEYSRSLQAFTSFIEGNKGHKLMANALYWQGESAYSQGDYLGAILSFKSITSQFPKHAKSADALLKIGMSYERLKDPDNAQFYWQVLLDDFPKSSAARVARGKMPR